MTAVLDDVKARLAVLGYEVQPEDAWALNYCIDRAAQAICDACNLDVVPDGLHYAQVDRACGEFLQAKYSTGKLSEETAQAAVQSIKEGDTTVQLSTGSSLTQRMAAAITSLQKAGENEFAKYRKLVW
ncbi:hypothetical protein [Caproicibacterium sp. XB1]|uniref:hypothetical protein n=1 Tax=Caproicibacterium sp. XB1 TaxID=3396405 RepID=UPI0039B6F94B